MVLKMEEKELIRKLVIVQGLSQREVNRRFGWSRDSIADALRNPELNAYRRDQRGQVSLSEYQVSASKNQSNRHFAFDRLA